MENPDLKWLFKELYAGISEMESLKTFGAIALVYTTGSIFIRSFSFHLIHTLHWADNSVSVLQGGWGTIATLAVTIGGGVIADKMGPAKLQLRVVLGICIFLIVFNGLGMYWYNRPLSVSGLLLWNFADPMFSVAAMPVLMALCRKKVEGSQFTAYMAMVNFCDVMGAYISGWAMSITTAPVLGFGCGCLIFVVIVNKFFKRQRDKSAVIVARVGSI